jgi:antitoxin component of MazEF toxin-antitoxin module
MTVDERMKTWIQGAATCTLVIPKNIAAQYGLTDPSYVTVEATNEGILIRKLAV